MSVTCLCANPLNDVCSDPCDAVQYGNQIVKIFAQKMSGADFDGTLNNDISLAADWATKIGAVTDEKIALICNLSGSVRSSTEPTVDEGNDVPYGGSEVIERPQEITFDLKYFNQATFQSLDEVACWGKVRFWFLDNKDYLWVADDITGAGIVNGNVMTGNFSQQGIGTRNKATGNKLSWVDLCQPRPFAVLGVSTPLPFLATITV